VLTDTIIGLMIIVLMMESVNTSETSVSETTQRNILLTVIT
jgi:hypothetical protein